MKSSSSDYKSLNVVSGKIRLSGTGQLIIKPPLVVEIIRDMRILRRKFENNKSRKNFETKI